MKHSSKRGDRFDLSEDHCSVKQRKAVESNKHKANRHRFKNIGLNDIESIQEYYDEYDS